MGRTMLRAVLPLPHRLSSRPSWFSRISITAHAPVLLALNVVLNLECAFVEKQLNVISVTKHALSSVAKGRMKLDDTTAKDG